MDKSKLEHQVAGVERGVAFLQQEHLAMLTGLHLEITHLRRRCQGESPPSCPGVSLWLRRPSGAQGLTLSLVSISVELSGELNSRFPERVASGKSSEGGGEAPS